MSLGALPPLECFEIVWEGEVLFLLRIFGKFTCETIWSRAFVCWKFLDYCCISLDVISLFRFSDSSWFIFGRLHVPRNLSMSYKLPSFLACSCSQCFLTILCIFLVSVVISPLSFLVLFLWVLSLFFLMSLVKGLSVLFIFSKNQLLV